MTENIVLNPTDHPVGTIILFESLGGLIEDIICRWSPGGRVRLRVFGWFEPSSLGLGVREILPGPQAPNAATDFAELVDACRELDAELLDEYDSETINSAIRRIRAIVGRGVKMPQEGGTDE